MPWFWCQRVAMVPMRREGGEEGGGKREIDGGEGKESIL